MAKNSSRSEFQYELMVFGRRLRSWRARRGLTQEQLSFDAGLDYSHISDLEHGKTNPTLTTILQLSQALQINPAVLFLNRDEAVKVSKQLGMQSDLDPPQDVSGPFP